MDDPASPFHAGERELQHRVGARDRVERSGQRLVRDYLPDEHRGFYAQLSLLFLGSIDIADRLLRLSLDEGILWEGIVPIQWRFTGWSPSLERTGSWQDDLPTPANASQRCGEPDPNMLNPDFKNTSQLSDSLLLKR